MNKFAVNNHYKNVDFERDYEKYLDKMKTKYGKDIKVNLFEKVEIDSRIIGTELEKALNETKKFYAVDLVKV